MENVKVPVEVDPTEDTEWNDILRSHGIIPERPPSPTAQLEEALEDAVRRQHENRLELKDLDELAELEDEEDEDFLQIYQQRRMHQLEELAKAKKFGMVYPVSKNEYELDVTDASENTYVLVHLLLQSSLQSRLLASYLTTAAKTFAELKFCDIPASRCIENYPESNCPTLIIYHHKAVLRQYVTLTELGGNNMKYSDLENVLVALGMVSESDGRLSMNQEDEDLQQERQLRFQKKSLRSSASNARSDDDDDDFYD